MKGISCSSFISFASNIFFVKKSQTSEKNPKKPQKDENITVAGSCVDQKSREQTAKSNVLMKKQDSLTGGMGSLGGPDIKDKGFVNYLK